MLFTVLGYWFLSKQVLPGGPLTRLPPEAPGEQAGTALNFSQATTPFVVLFESSSGSSWLMQVLAEHPRVCAVHFEPIDNISMASSADHAMRLRWLETLWSSPESTSSASWEAWRSSLTAFSTFGQLSLIRASLGRCSTRRPLIAFGLKARLSRLLGDRAAVAGLMKLTARRGVRVVHLSRRNLIKQAIAEYRRLHAGLGQFRTDAPASAGASALSAAAVQLPGFRRSLKAVERSRRLASQVVGLLGSVPILAIDYEDLLAHNAERLAALAAFLSLPPFALNKKARTAMPGGPTGGGGYVKATPDRLCAAVRNYAEICAAFAVGEYTGFFDEPCDTECSALG